MEVKKFQFEFLSAEFYSKKHFRFCFLTINSYKVFNYWRHGKMRVFYLFGKRFSNVSTITKEYWKKYNGKEKKKNM